MNIDINKLILEIQEQYGRSDANIINSIISSFELSEPNNEFNCGICVNNGKLNDRNNSPFCSLCIKNKTHRNYFKRKTCTHAWFYGATHDVCYRQCNHCGVTQEAYDFQ